MKNRIRELRFFTGVTQIDLAIKAGLQPSMLSYIERGIVEPKEAQKEKIARALKLTTGEVFPDEETKSV